VQSASASSASSSGSSLSPESAELLADHVQQRLQYFYFLGQMAAKALYDGIQIESQFALFFLRSCVGLSNYIDDLQGLDPQIHSSLMKLKALGDGAAGGDIAAMGLTFSVDRHAAGGAVRTVDLLPNGSNIAVTAENKVRFIYLLSDYYLSRQLSRQASAFQQGMASVLNLQWLRMFAAEELRLLLSGSQSFDVADLQRHTNYGSGYSQDHELIRWFWEIINEFDAEQRGQLLRFATSCSRAPLLGFQALQPQFCIQRVNADALEQNLPTAATCANLLRVPRFSSKQRLKEKLLYAITTASHGFGLT
jgi:ubiquitin-protein ligase E3 C